MTTSKSVKDMHIKCYNQNSVKQVCGSRQIALFALHN